MQQYCTIITIGDELLIGQVIDTNSAWMAQQLNGIGMHVKERISVGDVWHDIWVAPDDAARQSKLVLITGGLGPTADDITKPLLCTYFGGNMVVNEEALSNVKAIMARLKRPLIERNLKQSEEPDVCTVIQNKRGTAPGMWFEKEGVIFVSMPGVPFEMKGMMTDYVLPQVAQRLQLPTIAHRTLLTAGVGESFLAEMIEPWESKLPPHLKLAYLPNYGMVRLRLSGWGNNAQALQAEVNGQFEKLKELVAQHLITDEDKPLELALMQRLQQIGHTFCTAESCTGGYIASQVTKHPGASNTFWGSIVSYDNSIKINVLGVSNDSINQEGAVSQTVVEQMVQGALKTCNTHYAIAVSGIMGPNGGSPQKPVGTVWIAVGNAQRAVSRSFHFRFDRQRNIELTTANALLMLWQFLDSEEAS